MTGLRLSTNIILLHEILRNRQSNNWRKNECMAFAFYKILSHCLCAQNNTCDYSIQVTVVLENSIQTKENMVCEIIASITQCIAYVLNSLYFRSVDNYWLIKMSVNFSYVDLPPSFVHSA